MLIANPDVTSRQAAAIATLLSRELQLDYFEVLQRLRTPDSQFQYLARRLPASTADRLADKIEVVGFDGLYFERDPFRSYPANDVAANLVGFLGTDGKPLAGLELAFDARLSGRDGATTFEVGGDGQRLPLGRSETREPRNGSSLTTTIDRDVQWYMQRILEATARRAGAVNASAVALDVGSGEILALADFPTYDANEPRAADSPGLLNARSVVDVYEPGSVQKVLTAAALIDAKQVLPGTKIVVPSELIRNERSVGDYWDHGRLKLTMAGVIAKSSNIGTVLAAEQMSPARLYGYLRQFGLGQRTQLGLPGETAGLLAKPHRWSALKRATIAFGQGVSVNVVQMAAAVNTIANDGVFVAPRLLKGTGPTPATPPRRVVSQRTARMTARMMEAVVDPAVGTAPLADIAGYRVAGKTGTAQRVDDECGCYDGSVSVSFAGFAPADEPRFMVYVVVHNPRNGGGGGSVAAPAFRKVMSFLLQKYGVPPTGARAKPIPLEWG